MLFFPIFAIVKHTKRSSDNLNTWQNLKGFGVPRTRWVRGFCLGSAALSRRFVLLVFLETQRRKSGGFAFFRSAALSRRFVLLFLERAALCRPLFCSVLECGGFPAAVLLVFGVRRSPASLFCSFFLENRK